MAFARKKIYREGSPGSKRAARGVTLAQIKRDIAASPTPAQARKQYKKLGVLG